MTICANAKTEEAKRCANELLRVQSRKGESGCTHRSVHKQIYMQMNWWATHNWKANQEFGQWCHVNYVLFLFFVFCFVFKIDSEYTKIYLRLQISSYFVFITTLLRKQDYFIGQQQLHKPRNWRGEGFGIALKTYKEVQGAEDYTKAVRAYTDMNIYFISDTNTITTV